MRRIHVALVLFAALLAGLATTLELLATSVAAAPQPIGGSHAVDLPGPCEPAASDAAPATLADDRQSSFAAEPTGAAIDAATGSPEQLPVPVGVLVVDATGTPQPGLQVGLCTTERLTGRPCILPLGTTGANGLLALPPHRLGTLVVDTAAGRIGSVERSEAATTVSLVLQPTGALVVDVVDAAGRPIDGARVALIGTGGTTVTNCDTAGRTGFPQLALDGELTLRASSAGRSAELKLPAHRPAGRTLHQVVVLDGVPHTLATAVVDADGTPWCERLLRCTFADGRSLRVTSDALGRITIPLPSATTGSPTTALDLRLELLDARGRLSGASAMVTATPNDGTTTLAPVRLVMPPRQHTAKW
jgi:hypothetical protein